MPDAVFRAYTSPNVAVSFTGSSQKRLAAASVSFCVNLRPSTGFAESRMAKNTKKYAVPSPGPGATRYVCPFLWMKSMCWMEGCRVTPKRHMDSGAGAASLVMKGCVRRMGRTLQIRGGEIPR